MSGREMRRLWVMDWFGHLVSQSQENAALQRHYLRPGDYPDTFVLGEWPFSVPASVKFRRAMSIARGLPDAKFVDAGENLVALEDQDTGTFFSIDPHNHDTHWDAVAVYDWERFILLTKEMLDGLTILLDRSYGDVRMNEHPAPILVWPSVAENIGNFAWLGGFAFSISRNLKSLAELGQAAVGVSTEVTFVSNFGDVVRLVVVRSDKPFA